MRFKLEVLAPIRMEPAILLTRKGAFKALRHVDGVLRSDGYVPRKDGRDAAVTLTQRTDKGERVRVVRRYLATNPITVAFTGHRPDKLGGYGGDSPLARRVQRALEEVVRRVIRQYPGSTFISGMAPGVDRWGAEVVIALRDAGAPCRLVAAVPFRGQELRWPEESQRRYRELLGKADEVVVLVEPEGEVSYEGARRWLLERNRWVVQRAHLVLAVWDGSSGGTAHTVREALRLKKNVLRFDPRRPEMGWRKI